MEDLEKVKAKIRALLNKKVENGCTEDEQEAAERMAAGWMAKHGIEKDQFDEGQPSKAKRGKFHSQEYTTHQIQLALAAGFLFGCTVLKGAKLGLEFIGRDENIEMAEETFFFLLSQVEKLYKQALPKGLSKSERAEYRRSFKNACAIRVVNRAKKLVEDLKNAEATAQALTGSTALVVKGYFEKLEAENQGVLAELKTKKGRASSVKFGSGSIDGRAAGDKVQLKHRELKS